MKQTPLFYTRPSIHFKQNLQSKRLKYTSVVRQAVHLGQKGALLSEATDNEYYDVPGDVNTIHPAVG